MKRAPRVATATISDSRTLATDRSGPLLRTLCEEAQVEVLAHQILPDEPARLAAFLNGLANVGSAEAVILTGGTGIGPRDQTWEALSALLEKRLDGFGEAFRRLSWEQIGPRAILSRALAGTFRGLIVYALPGSPAAVELGLRALILPTLQHAIDLLQGRTDHIAATP